MFFGWRERELAQRRLALVARSAALRAELVEGAAALDTPLQLADGAWNAWHWVKAHPDVVVAGVVVVAVVQPRRAWVLARWSWRGWRTWRWLRSIAAEAQAGFVRSRRRAPAR
jgi:hypothetical protein